jgi:DNA-directed RNA polymerase specialized sigma subunit
VRSEIVRFRIDHGTTVRVPVHRHGVANRVFKELRRLSRCGVEGRAAEEAARENLGLSVDTFESLAAPLLRGVSSLDELVGSRADDPGQKRMDVIPSEAELAEELYSREERRRILAWKVQAVIRQEGLLTERERDILRTRVMGDDEDAEILQTIGDRYGLSRERIRQNERQVIQKLRHEFMKDRGFVNLLRQEGYLKGRETEEIMMSTRQSVGHRAVVVHGNQAFYEQNGIARKLADRGVSILRVYQVKSPSSIRKQDWGGADFVVSINTMIDRDTSRAIKEEGKARGVVVYDLSHRVSEWGAFEVATGVHKVAEDLGVVVELPRKEVAAPPPPPSVADRIATELRDNEELARIWQKEAEETRLEIARVRREKEELVLECEGLRKTSGVVVREQLVADVARKEAERVHAVREKTEILGRLEASETLCRRWEGESKRLRERLEREDRSAVGAQNKQLAEDLQEAKKRVEELHETCNSLGQVVRQQEREILSSREMVVPGDESVSMKKLRAILAACGSGVIDNDEAVAKIAKVLS